ncbi:hypothetical protein [Streptomyces sp. NBC_00091]|uniref:hypothetical protein n=1 Tax=Streptomyces sp. NBC_00091 TaxID=2975648 RepID=UPI0022552996|nr:hypothetical protein [Streptomyces sp. NBC_00091]MCX5377940.1 hypothetical protein [Streptomyces sp. NBC_00091]
MRLRTTAVALAGALTLVLPTAAQALADDGKALNYSFLQDGVSKSGQVSDLTEGKCHLLSVSDAASLEEIANETDKVALLFDNKACEGEPVLAAGPGEKAGDFEAVAVVFEDAAGQGEKREEAGQGEKPEEAAPAPAEMPAAPVETPAETPAEAPAETPAEASDESDEEEEEEGDLLDAPFRALG